MTLLVYNIYSYNVISMGAVFTVLKCWGQRLNSLEIKSNANWMGLNSRWRRFIDHEGFTSRAAIVMQIFFFNE